MSAMLQILAILKWLCCTTPSSTLSPAALSPPVASQRYGQLLGLELTGKVHFSELALGQPQQNVCL